MRNIRFRLTAGLAGATLCLFAVTSYGQTPTTTGSPDASAQTTPATQPATPAPTGTATDPAVPVTDITTTETTTWSFPGGIWGILAAAAVVLLIFFALFRGRDKTVIKETYVAPNTGPTTRTGTGTSVGDRNLSPRAASGPGTTGTGGINDPNPRGMNDPNPRG